MTILDEGLWSMMTEGVDVIPSAFGSLAGNNVGTNTGRNEPYSQFLNLQGGLQPQFALTPENQTAGMFGSTMIPGQAISPVDPITSSLMQQQDLINQQEEMWGMPAGELGKLGVQAPTLNQLNQMGNLSNLGPGGMNQKELQETAKKVQQEYTEKKDQAIAKWSTIESELEKQLGDKDKAVSTLVAAEMGEDPLNRTPEAIEALAERTNEARANRAIRDERIEKAGGLQNLLTRQIATAGEIQTTLPDGTVIKESPSQALAQNRFPGILDMTNVDENGDLVIEDQATDQATAGALDTLGEDVPLGLKGTERPAPLGEQTDTAAARAAMNADNVNIDAAGNVTQAGQAGMVGQIGQANQAGQIGFLGTESRDPYTAIPGLEEYFDPTMLETPYDIYQKQRLGDISGVPLGVLLDPNLQNALSRGYNPAMGRFLLQQALQTGADFPGGELGMGTTEAFQDFLEENQRLATADYRTGYSDLADYLRMMSQPQALEGMPPAQLARWTAIFDDGTDEKMRTGILQMSIAALGVPPGMGGRAYNGLAKIYDVMITRYGEIAGRAQFTNWVASAYPVPYKNVAQNQDTKVKVINNAVNASAATNSNEVNQVADKVENELIEENLQKEINEQGMQPERALAATGQDVYAPTPEEAAVVSSTTDQPVFETDKGGRVIYPDRPKTPSEQKAAEDAAKAWMERQKTMIGGMPQVGMPGLGGDLPTSPMAVAKTATTEDQFNAAKLAEQMFAGSGMNIPKSLGGQYGEDAQGVYELRKDGAKTYLKDPKTGLSFGIAGDTAYTIGGTPTTNRTFNISDYSNLVETLYPSRERAIGKGKQIDYSVIAKTPWETKYPKLSSDPYLISEKQTLAEQLKFPKPGDAGKVKKIKSGLDTPADPTKFYGGKR